MNKLFVGWVTINLLLPVAAMAQADQTEPPSAASADQPGQLEPPPPPVSLVVGPLPAKPLAYDKIEVSASAFAGWFDNGYGANGPMIRSDFNLKGAHKFDGGIEIGFTTDIDFILRGANPYAVQVEDGLHVYLEDYTLWADFGKFGKLLYTTEGHCISEDAPWVDGEIYSENNTSVWHVIAPNFRCVGGAGPLLDFPGYAIPAEDYIMYQLRYQRFSLDAYYDNDLLFVDHITGQSWSGDETATVFGGDLAPQFELQLGYRFDFASIQVAANDLEDRLVRIIKVVPQYDLLLIASREWQDGQGADPLTIFLASWTPRQFDLFRGASLEVYLDDSDAKHTESYIAQISLGTDIWQTDFAVDREGDVAFEAAYNLNDRTRFLLGYDNGLNGHNGKDRFYSGAPDPVLGWRDAPDRGRAWEFGIEFKL